MSQVAFDLGDELPRELGKRTSLHEQTVVAAARHAAAAEQSRPGSRQSAAVRRPQMPLTHHIVVHPDVLRAALKLAHGDASRLQIVSSTTVYVR